MRAAVLVAALLVGLLLLPLGSASHNMGHRYIVTGRIIDAAGMPVQDRDVTMRLVQSGSVVSSIVVSTDCHGDYISWKGRMGPEQEPPRPGQSGYGEIENIQSHDPPYVNFHFHSPFLSDRLKFNLTVGSESWEAGFRSAQRQTIDYHQVSATYPPSARCGSFDAFNRTLTVRVFVSSAQEYGGVEGPARVRKINVTYEGTQDSGDTDFFFDFMARIENTTVRDGGQVRIQGTDVGSETLRLSANSVKFRRADGVYISGNTAAGVLDDLQNFGILLLIVAIIAGAYFGGRRLKARAEEKNLRQMSTRRRFRRQKGEE